MCVYLCPACSHVLTSRLRMLVCVVSVFTLQSKYFISHFYQRRLFPASFRLYVPLLRLNVLWCSAGRTSCTLLWQVSLWCALMCNYMSLCALIHLRLVGWCHACVPLYAWAPAAVVSPTDEDSLLEYRQAKKHLNYERPYDSYSRASLTSNPCT